MATTAKNVIPKLKLPVCMTIMPISTGAAALAKFAKPLKIPPAVAPTSAVVTRASKANTAATPKPHAIELNDIAAIIRSGSVIKTIT